MIVQNIGASGHTDFSFTVNRSEYQKALDVLERERGKGFTAREIIGDNRICKVSVVGIGMRSHVGIASKMFKALADEGINIQMISTSEIKISVVIDEKYLELAVRVLHRAFELDQAPDRCVKMRFGFRRNFLTDTRRGRKNSQRPERWPSGRRHSPAKGAYGSKLYRGFESLSLRQISMMREILASAINSAQIGPIRGLAVALARFISAVDPLRIHAEEQFALMVPRRYDVCWVGPGH